MYRCLWQNQNQQTTIEISKMISQELTTQLAQIIKEDYGVKLTPEETLDFGNRLIQYAEICYKVLSNNQNSNETI
jgi:hypothetical protein